MLPGFAPTLRQELRESCRGDYLRRHCCTVVATVRTVKRLKSSQMTTRVALGGFEPNDQESGGRWTQFNLNFVGPALFSSAYKLDLHESFIRIGFITEKDPYILPNDQPPGFREGLWRADCGELWLANPGSVRYLEINLAPNGDWWACVFSSPRTRDFGTEPPQCSTENFVSANAWYVWINLPKAEIERCLGTSENLVGNVTLVLGGCDHPDEKLENLHSIVQLGAHDFHRPQDWVPLSNLI